MDRCALFVDAGYALADGAQAVHGTRHRDAVSWDYAGLLTLLATLAQDHSGLPVLRCYWYDAAAGGRRTADQDELADLPGVKLRLGAQQPGRESGETGIPRDLLRLAGSRGVSDVILLTADESLCAAIADVQDAGIRVAIMHITTGSGATMARALRQECDDVIEITAAHLRPFAELVTPAEPVSRDDQPAAATYQGGEVTRGRDASLAQPAAAAGSLTARSPSYREPGADYRRAESTLAGAASASGYGSSQDQGSRPDETGSDGGRGNAAASQPGGRPTAQASAPGLPGPALPDQGPPVQRDHEQAGGLSGPEQPYRPAEPVRDQAQPGPAHNGPGPVGVPAQNGYGQGSVPAGGRGGPVPGNGSYVPNGYAAHGYSQTGLAQDGLPQGRESGPRPGGPGGRGTPYAQDPGAAAANGLPSAGRPEYGPGATPDSSRPQNGLRQPAPPGYRQDSLAPQGRGGLPPGGLEPPAPARYQQRDLPAGPSRTGPQSVSQPGGLPSDSQRPAAIPQRPGDSSLLYPAPPFSAGQSAHGQTGSHTQPASSRPVQASGPYDAPSGLPPARFPDPVPDSVQAAHAEGFGFGEAVARDAPALWLEAVLARKPRMPSDLEARLLQGSALPVDSLLQDEVRHALRRGFWDALERSRR